MEANPHRHLQIKLFILTRVVFSLTPECRKLRYMALCSLPHILGEGFWRVVVIDRTELGEADLHIHNVCSPPRLQRSKRVMMLAQEFIFIHIALCIKGKLAI